MILPKVYTFDILSLLLIFILIQGFSFGIIDIQSGELFGLWMIITSLFSFGIIYFWAKRKHQKVYKKSLDFSFKVKKSVLYYIVLIVITYATAIISEYIMHPFPVPDILLTTFLKISKPHLTNWIHIILIAPFLEEILFRGIIYQKLYAVSSPQRAVFLSAFLFGIIHLNFWQALPAFLIGLSMSGLRHICQASLSDTFFMHLVNNATLMWLVNRFDIKTFNIIYFFVQETYLHILIFIISSSLLILSWWWLRKVHISHSK